MSVLDKIMELEAQKQQLLDDAKKELITAAEKAVADLNNLGFHYRLVEGTAPAPVSSGGRRTGVPQSVLEVVQKSADGVSPAMIAEQLGMTDKRGKQSIANALSNLKKANQVAADSGIYRTV